MNYFKGKNKEFSFRDLIYKALIFIGTVGVIVYFLPRDGKFNYQFDIDKPWKYGQLMATFDFPIYKDDQVVKKEQDSILASFQPYFQLDKSTGKEALKKLKNDYQTHLRDILPSSDYIRHIEKILSEVYRAGIHLKLVSDFAPVGDVGRDKVDVVDDAAEVVLCRGAYIAADAQGELPFSVRQQEAGCLRFVDVGHLRLVHDADYLVARFVYGDQYDTFGRLILDNHFFLCVDCEGRQCRTAQQKHCF